MQYARLAEAITPPGSGPDLTPRVLADAVMSVHQAVIDAYRRAEIDGEEPAAYGPRTLSAARAAFRMLAEGLATR